MIDDVQKSRLNQLRFHDGRDDLDQRLSWKNHGSLRDRIEVSGEMEMQKVFQKALVKCPGGAQIGDVFFVKGKPLHIIDQLVQAGTDRVSSVIRIGAVERVKHNLRIASGFEISLHHCQFIKICEKRQLHGTHGKGPPFSGTIRL